MQSSIIIPARNEEQNLGGCLQAVFSQQGVGEFEVIVIDSGSEDRTREIAQQFPVRLIPIAAAEFHHGRTRNLGASHASGEFLVFLSADAIPATPHWLAALLAPFADPAIVAVYGSQLPRPEALPERRFFMQHRYGPAPRDSRNLQAAGADYQICQFSTVNGALRRSVWERFRFPEDLNAYEDIGISQRIVAAGLAIRYEPAAAVTHSHNYPLWYSFRQYFDSGVVFRRRQFGGAAQVRRMRADGWRYLRSELGYLARQGHLARCPYALSYEAARYLGLALGRRETWLPRPLKRKLSSHRLFD